MTTFEGGASINSEDGIILSGELDQPKRPFQDEHFVLNLTKLQEVPKYFVGNIEIVVDVTDYDHFRISFLSVQTVDISKMGDKIFA